MSTTLDTLQLDGWQLAYFTGLAMGYPMQMSTPGPDDQVPTVGGIELLPVLLKMRTVMKGADGKAAWMARAEGCEEFARGDSPAVAMCRALILVKFGKTVVLHGAQMDMGVCSYTNDSMTPGATDCEDLFA